MICDDFVEYAMKILDPASSTKDITNWLLMMAFELGEDNQRMMDMEDEISAIKADHKEPNIGKWMRDRITSERRRIEDDGECSKAGK